MQKKMAHVAGDGLTRNCSILVDLVFISQVLTLFQLIYPEGIQYLLAKPLKCKSFVRVAWKMWRRGLLSYEIPETASRYVDTWEIYASTPYLIGLTVFVCWGYLSYGSGLYTCIASYRVIDTFSNVRAINQWTRSSPRGPLVSLEAIVRTYL